MGITTRERLERSKLEAEIRKTTVEAELLELRLATETRANEDAIASEYEHRIYTFSDTISKDTAEECIATLGQWARREPGPITVVFNSPGGIVLHGLALYDYLRLLSAHGNPITTVATGRTCSMAGVVMQAGDRREITPSAYFHIHEVSAGTVGKLAEMEDDIAHSSQLWDRGVAILASKSKLTAAQIKRRASRREWWMDAAETVKLGFVDGVHAA